MKRFEVSMNLKVRIDAKDEAEAARRIELFFEDSETELTANQIYTFFHISKFNKVKKLAF